MDARQKIEFVEELTGRIKAEIVKNIEEGKIPESWDGMELRELIADKAAASGGYLNGRTRRGRDYKNTVMINNL